MQNLEEGQLEDYEYPDVDESVDESDDCYINCPECGALVYDDSPQCTECDHYISAMPKISSFTKYIVLALLIAFVLFAVVI